MTLGEKIKKLRKEKKLTQSALAGNEITRNMLSEIESNKATPSLSTLRYIAQNLDITLEYLVSEDDDPFFYKKKERIKAIKSSYEAKNYSACISLILKLEQLDDELAYILCTCYFELGVASTKNGSFKSGISHLENSRFYATKTLYDTRRLECLSNLYLAIAKNVSSPLLEFDEKRFIPIFYEITDYDFYKYVLLDFEYNYTYLPIKLHIEAKRLIKERRYADALTILLDIEEKRSEYEYNSYITYGVYSDIELCYKKLFNFEGAYRYSSKRLSLIEGFNS